MSLIPVELETALFKLNETIETGYASKIYKHEAAALITEIDRMAIMTAADKLELIAVKYGDRFKLERPARELLELAIMQLRKNFK